MTSPTVDPAIAGTRFGPYEFSWTWQTTQLIARAAGCSISDERDRPLLLPGGGRSGHPMIAFNGALLARNRPEVMKRLIGGYDVWRQVGRWGSGGMEFLRPLPASGRARVVCGFGAVGTTSKGHALVRFEFEVETMDGGDRLASGWMLLFLLECGPAGGDRLSTPRISMPERAPDALVPHETPDNVTFDWAMPSEDWNPTHFEAPAGSPAPLVHGPRNMALVLHDVARLFAGGDPGRVRAITLGSLPAPHYPGEATETRAWMAAERTVLVRLLVPAASRRDGGAGDKVVVDQIECRMA